MKVLALLNLGTGDFPNHALAEGEVRDVPDEVAVKMVRMGVAISAEEPQTPRQLVKPPPGKKTEQQT